MKKTVRMLCVVSVIIGLFLTTRPAYAGDINVSAAASLREVVAELTANFAKAHPQAKFLNNLGASGALAKQIENGAPADIFFSANLEWMDYLKARKLLEEKSIGVFAFNSLVFVGMPDVKVKRIEDLPTLEKIAIGSPRSVPAGDYAMKALKKAGIYKQLENRLVMAKDVRECLMYAEKGEVSGAFVYKTDALHLAKKAKILFVVPQELYPKVIYPVGLTVSGSKKAEAVAFHKYLQSIEAKGTLTKHGFVAN